MLATGLSIFFDLDGFASTHTVNGKSIVCVIGDKLSGRSELDGSWVEQFDILAKKTDIVPAPTRGGYLTVDGVQWTVDSVKDDGEVYTFTVSTKRLGEMIDAV